MRSSVAVLLALSLVACAANNNNQCKPEAPPSGSASACSVGAPVPEEGRATSESHSNDTLADPSPLEAVGEPSVDGSNSTQTIALIREALQADQAGDLDLCIAKDKEALTFERSPRIHLHLASCESRKGKLVDSLKDSERALESGIQKHDASVMKIARRRVLETLARIPHVSFKKEAATPPLKLTFDGKDVPYDVADKKFSIDPGKHVVEVTRLDSQNVARVSRCDVLVNERTFTPITIR